MRNNQEYHEYGENQKQLKFIRRFNEKCDRLELFCDIQVYADGLMFAEFEKGSIAFIGRSYTHRKQIADNEEIQDIDYRYNISDEHTPANLLAMLKEWTVNYDEIEFSFNRKPITEVEAILRREHMKEENM